MIAVKAVRGSQKYKWESAKFSRDKTHTRGSSSNKIQKHAYE